MLALQFKLEVETDGTEETQDQEVLSFLTDTFPETMRTWCLLMEDRVTISKEGPTVLMVVQDLFIIHKETSFWFKMMISKPTNSQ
jgi:hypothetical protein